MIRTGKLDRRIALLREAPASDDGAAVVPGGLRRLAWRWASVKPERGSEGFEHESKVARHDAVIWLRRDAVTRTLRPTDKVAIDGILHELVSPPQMIARREGVELFVRGIAAEPIDPASLTEWTA